MGVIMKYKISFSLILLLSSMNCCFAQSQYITIINNTGTPSTSGSAGLPGYPGNYTINNVNNGNTEYTGNLNTAYGVPVSIPLNDPKKPLNDPSGWIDINITVKNSLGGYYDNEVWQVKTDGSGLEKLNKCYNVPCCSGSIISGDPATLVFTIAFPLGAHGACAPF
jgi:hypothetical protein